VKMVETIYKTILANIVPKKKLILEDINFNSVQKSADEDF